MRDAETDEGDPNRVQALIRVVGDKRELQSEAGRGSLQILGRGSQKDVPRLVAPRPREHLECARQPGKGQCCQPDGGPYRRMARQGRPAEHEQEEERGRQQAASQVVENFPPADEWQMIPCQAGARRHERKQPPEDLPVATHPAVLPSRVGEDAGRIVVHHLDVGHQRRASVEPLEQIVREQRVLRHAALERRRERIDVVQAFAGENAFVEEILIDVRDGSGVGVDAGVAGVRPREE